MALSAAHDARAVEPLLTFLKREDVLSLARMFAIEALGTLCDKDEHLWSAKYADGVNYLAKSPSLTDSDHVGIFDFE